MYLNSSHCSTILGMEFYSTRRMPVRKLYRRPAIRLLLVSWRSKVVDVVHSRPGDGRWDKGDGTLPSSLRFSSIICLLARQPKTRDRSLSSPTCHAESPNYIRSHDFAENRLDPPQRNCLSSRSCSPAFPSIQMFLLHRAAILFQQNELQSLALGQHQKKPHKIGSIGFSRGRI